MGYLSYLKCTNRNTDVFFIIWFLGYLSYLKRTDTTIKHDIRLGLKCNKDVRTEWNLDSINKIEWAERFFFHTWLRILTSLNANRNNIKQKRFYHSWDLRTTDVFRWDGNGNWVRGGVCIVFYMNNKFVNVNRYLKQ